MNLVIILLYNNTYDFSPQFIKNQLGETVLLQIVGAIENRLFGANVENGMAKLYNQMKTQFDKFQAQVGCMSQTLFGVNLIAIKLANIPYGGNCVFIVLTHQLYGGGTDHKTLFVVSLELRIQVVEILRQPNFGGYRHFVEFDARQAFSTNDLIKHLSDDELKRYVNSLEDPEINGGIVALVIISKLYEVNTIIIDEPSGNVHLVNTLNPKYKRTICLIYRKLVIDGSYRYDSVMSVQ